MLRKEKSGKVEKKQCPLRWQRIENQVIGETQDLVLAIILMVFL